MASSLSTKLVRIGTGLLLVALASIGLTLWVTWQLEGGAAAVNEAGRLRMQTWRLASAIQANVPEAERHTLVAKLDDSLRLLKEGDPARPLFVPWDPEVSKHFAGVEATWQNQRNFWQTGAPGIQSSVRTDAELLVKAIDGLVSVIEKQLSGFTTVLNLFQFVMMALAIAASVVMLYVGYRFIISPLAQVRDGLLRVKKGDFTARIDVHTQDEFGQVAAGFNRMTETLHSLYAGLEAQVMAKTRDIEAQRKRLETLYAVSALLSKAGTIDEASKGFAQSVRVHLGADAAAVRWSDEANQRFLMLSSDCFPEELVESERSLLVGACACGISQGKQHPDTRVIPIQSLDDATRRPCAKLGYESVISVPIKLQQRLLGELNLFYRAPVQVSAEETELLDTLGSHLASTLESLRAAALEREAAVGEERSLLARELHDSIAQSLAFLNIQSQLLRNAIQKNQPDNIARTLNELDAGLKESMADVRELLVHFRTRTSTDDIEAALKETLQKFQHQTGLPTLLEVEGDGLPLPPDVQIQVLHIIQESLSNIRKHAQATHVALNVIKGPGWVFEVVDNGVGFDTWSVRVHTHVGLKIMQERAARIGAQVNLDSHPGMGTRMTLTLPDASTVTETVALAGIRH
ncbi:MAG TPA: type IV pili methyl-accepting chemotaxis transducer N-terminal domain-containing protein [Burkholderiaceae bacterium]|nr:type IV pili methyl-accepting chemotaxis transducer N-terminal domain-containing protein [Burkholderiaceae bacterium]